MGLPHSAKQQNSFSVLFLNPPAIIYLKHAAPLALGHISGKGNPWLCPPHPCPVFAQLGRGSGWELDTGQSRFPLSPRGFSWSPLPLVPLLAAHGSCCRSPISCPGVATATGSSPGANDRAGGRGEGCRSVAGAEGSWLQWPVETSPCWPPGTVGFARWIPALLEVSRTPCCL